MSTNWPPARVALIYDRVNTPHGGAELVLQTFREIFPEITLFSSVVDLNKAVWARSFAQIVPSWLQHFPKAASLHRWLAEFMPLAFEMFDLSSYDLVISVSSAEAKGVITLPHQLHVSYVLAPPRYLYHQKAELLEAHILTRLPGIRSLALKALAYLEWWDQVAIHRPDVLIPLSHKVSKQIQTTYKLAPKALAEVMYPPVQLPPESVLEPSEFPAALIKKGFSPDQPYFLQVGRLVNYKKAHLSIAAAAQNQVNLIIVGEGPETQRISRQIKKLTRGQTFKILQLGSVKPDSLDLLYRHCAAVLAPGEEDFGLTALEANAYGKPVILFKNSGAAEIIQHKKHGWHLQNQTIPELAAAMSNTLNQAWQPKLLRQNAAKYDTSMFVTAFEKRLQTLWHLKQHSR